MAGTILFLGLSIGFALLLWYGRPSRAHEDGRTWLRTIWLIVLPWAAFIGALLANNGDRLTARVTQLRVPLSTIAATPETGPRPYLVVGDRPEAADLVVTPYADQSLSRISMPPDARSFVTIDATRVQDSRGNALPDAHLRVQSFDAQPDFELPGMGVKLDGRTVAPGDQQSFPLVPGTPLRVSIARIDADGGTSERRSFSITLRHGRSPAIELDLDSPLVADAGTCEMPRLRLAPMVNAGAREQVFRDPENLVFNGLGTGGRHPVIDANWLGPIAEISSLCARTQTSFAWPSGVDRSDARLQLVSQRVFLPWFCCVFVTLGAIALHLLCARCWRLPTPERIVVPLLQWLMALRLLIAVAGYYNDTDLIPWRVLWDGMAAFLCVPVLAVIALRPGGGRALAPLMTGLAVLVASGFAALWLSLRAIDWWSIPTVLCYVTVIAAIGRIWLGGREAPLSAAVGFLARRLGQDPEPATNAMPPARADTAGRALSIWRALPPTFCWGLTAIALLVALRLTLLGFGILSGRELTERLFGIPLSLLYVPGTIIGFSLLLEGGRALRPSVALFATLAAFIAAYIVVPIATRDFGAIFVHAWPLAAVIAWFGLRRGAGAPAAGRLLWAFPAASPILIVGVLGLSFIAQGPIPSPVGPPPSPSARTAERDAPSPSHLGPHLAEVTRWDRNSVRLLAYLSPDEVEQLGTKFAFESLDLITSLGPLTADLAGRGYLAPSNVRPPLLDNQYFENLPAVHLIWPLGRLGALGLLIVVVAATAALRPAASSNAPQPPDWRALAAIMAQATFVWAALYMVLANLNWVPFTGRNVYLLTVTSGGDLAEGLLLVLLMCAPFAPSLVAKEG